VNAAAAWLRRACFSLPLLLMLALAPMSAQAGMPAGWCSRATSLDATQQDRLLRLAVAVHDLLQAQPGRVAVVARSGTALGWLGERYSHAGLALRDNPLAPWAVRQLFFACEEREARLFDQGLPAFVQDLSDPELGFVAVLLLPPEAEAPLARTALDETQARALLEPRYNAGSYAFSLRDQNCNQWLAEMLALAWGEAPEPRRAWAQHWLRGQGYQPAQLRPGLLALAQPFLPWVDPAGQPAWAQGLWQTSLPSSIERFVRQRWPQARRWELCLRGDEIHQREGWDPLPEDCRP
jgi:hypothetical protein